MKTVLFRTMALTAIVALVAFGGCSSDDDTPASPPGPGNPGFTLPAGMYNVTFDFADCTGTPIQNESALEIWCKAEVIDELPGDLDCTPTPVGTDSMTIDCSGTVNDGGCSYDWTAVGGGKKVGSTWTLTFRVTLMNETPPSCSGIGASCVDMMISAEMIAGPPSACAYADVNTIEATIGGGPMGGKVPMDIYGASAFSTTGGPEWFFYGGYSDFEIFAAQSSQGGSSQDLSMNLDAIDPKSLPATVNVTGTTGGVSSAGGGNLVTYSEYDFDSGHNFQTTGGGGILTIQEVSDEHIAGTMNLTLDGMSYSGPGTAAQETSTRNITGGFYVDTRVLDAGTATNDFATQLGRRMIQSLRGYVR